MRYFISFPSSVHLSLEIKKRSNYHCDLAFFPKENSVPIVRFAVFRLLLFWHEMNLLSQTISFFIIES
jgi:hypothetical protein